MNTRRQRVRAALRWTVTGIFIALALLLPSNLLLRYRVNVTPTVSLRVFDGLLALNAADRPMPMGFYWQPESRPHVKFELKFFTIAGSGWAMTVPMIVPLGLSAAAAAVFWWRERVEHRRKMVGHCRKCGYDLQGLASAACPECGAKDIATAPKPTTA
jgi:hypothetical protein